jgi:septum formation protein
MGKSLILASVSPRRAALLAGLGVEFTVVAPGVDELPRYGEAPDELVLRLSQEKAQAVGALHPEAVVLAADTVVVHKATALGKPADAADAVEMLRALRGRVHQVYTAVSVVSNGNVASRLSASDVWMRDYSDAEIRAYVASGDPLDKAGAYAIQHPAFAPVDHFDGCFTAIMGLPVAIAAEMLKQAGIGVPADGRAACEQYTERCCQRPPRAEEVHEQ